MQRCATIPFLEGLRLLPLFVALDGEGMMEKLACFREEAALRAVLQRGRVEDRHPRPPVALPSIPSIGLLSAPHT